MTITEFVLVILVGWGSNVSLAPEQSQRFATEHECEQAVTHLKRWRHKKYGGKMNPKFDGYCVPRISKETP